MIVSLQQLRGAELLTHSRMRCFKTCPRKHYNRYELGIRPTGEAGYFRFGRAVHVGLDVHAKGADRDASIVAALAGYEVIPPWCRTEEQVNDLAVEATIARELLLGYWWYWEEHEHPTDIDVAEIVESEASFEIPIQGNRTFHAAGKRDRIVRTRDGRLMLMENKTTSDSLDPASDYWKKLLIDEQISLYILAARTNGHALSSVLYDAMRKPGIAPKIVDRKTGTRETPAEFGARLAADIRERPTFYYARREIPRLDRDLEEFERDLRQQAVAIRHAQRNGHWYRNTGACVGFGRCEYLDVCHSGIDLDALPTGFERIENIHPELEEAHT